MTLALPLALEARERGLMTQPPRPPGTPVLGRALLIRTVVVSLLMTVSALALQAAFVYLPPMQDVFGSAPLGLDGWLLALGAAVTVLPVVEAEKW